MVPHGLFPLVYSASVIMALLPVNVRGAKSMDALKVKWLYSHRGNAAHSVFPLVDSVKLGWKFMRMGRSGHPFRVPSVNVKMEVFSALWHNAHPCHAPLITLWSYYLSGSNWEENPCTHCSCLAGQISCFETTCPTLSCSKEEKEITYKGSCCPVCAHKKDWCTLESGTLIPHGNLIHSRSEKCSKDEQELCSCNHGKISCTSVTCQTTNCGYGKKMKMDWDETSDKSCQCPKCVPDLKLCYFDRRQRKSGESWFVGCRLCECLEGRVLCYTPTCPACNDGFSPSSSVIPFSFLSFSVSSSSTSTSSSSCCPECRRKTCPAECLSCYPVLGGQSFTRVIKYSALSVANNASNIISFCTACNKGFLLQDGRCVAVCGEGMYEKDARCLLCHPNCLACNGGTPFHCTRCHTSHVLREGQCVQECGKGYFSNSAICHKCHRNCHECFGRSATECLSCHKEAKLFNGTCVKECPNDYLN
ncbi:Proprotein convertase subtilisin/kexin type 5, partial [Armadillidium nasatum]